MTQPAAHFQSKLSKHDAIAALAWLCFVWLMKHSQLSQALIALANRLKTAAMGFGFTVVPLGIIAVAQFILLPQIVGTIEGLDRNENAHAISDLRTGWLWLHLIEVMLVAIYWLLTAMLCRGELLRLKAANAVLALFVIGAMILTLYGSFIRMPDDLKGLCRFLGLSDNDAPPFGFDAPSTCGAFTFSVHPLMQLGLMGLMILFLSTSCVIRIVSSRRARSASE